jgi:hypothetical protein
VNVDGIFVEGILERKFMNNLKFNLKLHVNFHSKIPMAKMPYRATDAPKLQNLYESFYFVDGRKTH